MHNNAQESGKPSGDSLKMGPAGTVENATAVHVRLGPSRYGKGRVRVARVTRGTDGVHFLRELSIDVLTEGDFAASFLEGDNALVLPTDTMKNTMYVLAGRHGIESAEAFGELAGHFFLERNPAMNRVELTLRETRWERLTVDGQPHPHGFQASGFGRPTARVAVTRGTGDGGAAFGVEVESGIDDLCILKTTGSGFENYLRDDLTTLPPTDDRIFSTLLTGRWRYTRPLAATAYEAASTAVREALLAVFAREYSVSVQATLFSMGRAALAAVPELSGITLRMPNRHYLLFDLARFGLENANEVFYPIDEPHGQIEASVERG